MTQLAITAVGLATPVGHSALASVAALRSGIARFASVADVRLLDRSRTRASPAVAARTQFHRAAATSPEVADALLAAAVADAETWATPDRWEHVEGNMEAADLIHTPFLDQLISLAVQARPGAPPVGLAVADSLATPDVLARLAAAGRLKGDAAPSGLIPGEAGGAVVVEPLSTARAAGRTVLAVVESWGRGHEPTRLGGTEPSAASGLTEALRQAMSGMEEAPDLVVIDHNGGHARPGEWALAAPRALPRWHGQLPVWTPADGVGDTGQAVGAVLVTCAALALARGWADRVAVVASDDSGARAAVVLGRADAVGPRGERHESKQR